MKLDSSGGTHVYRPSKNARIFFAIVGSVTFIAGAWLLSWTLPACLAAFRNHSSVSDRLAASRFLAGVGFLLMVGGALQVRSYWKRILRLTARGVEVEFVYGSRSLDYGAILGRRSRATRYGSCTVLVPNEKRLRELVIKEGFVVDDFYNDWLASLPDLDAIDKEKRRAAGKPHFWET